MSTEFHRYWTFVFRQTELCEQIKQIGNIQHGKTLHTIGGQAVPKIFRNQISTYPPTWKAIRPENTTYSFCDRNPPIIFIFAQP